MVLIFLARIHSWYLWEIHFDCSIDFRCRIDFVIVASGIDGLLTSFARTYYMLWNLASVFQPCVIRQWQLASIQLTHGVFYGVRARIFQIGLLLVTLCSKYFAKNVTCKTYSMR